MVTIRELAAQGAFKGSQAHRVAEPQIQQPPNIDNASRGKPKVTTSVDCYVAGQYLGGKGRTIEVVQRYSIIVSYTADTQQQTMDQLRDTVLRDFQARYGQQFNVSNVFVPGLKAPPVKIPGLPPGERVAPVEMYMGAGVFRDRFRTDRLRYDIGTQKSIARTNIDSLKKRYRMR